MMKLRVLMVTAEYAPLAKAGGLADATAGLTSALVRLGHDARVVLPRYGNLRRDGIEKPIGKERQFLSSGTFFNYCCRESSAANDAPKAYLVDCPGLLDSPNIYGDGAAELDRFMLLCRAALELCGDLDWEPDVVHCHDWHTAAVPVLINALRARGPHFSASRTLLSLHNIGYQGIFPADAFAEEQSQEIAKAARQYDPELEVVNLLEQGILHADMLSTVSPTHARELQTPEFGMGLDHHLIKRSADMTGILNGVDYATWSPDVDDYLHRKYSIDTLPDKRANKMMLLEQLGLAGETDTPLIGMVSRLVMQKGIDLLIDALPELLEDGQLCFQILGDGDEEFSRALQEFATRFPNHIAFTQGHDEALAHRTLAGCDALLVPSRYEPCGLTQMYALRYGTVPVVRHTGGLADTIQHFNPDTATGNGCVFEDADASAVKWGLETVGRWYREPNLWHQLLRNGMRADFSWDRQVLEYETLYARMST